MLRQDNGNAGRCVWAGVQLSPTAGGLTQGRAWHSPGLLCWPPLYRVVQILHGHQPFPQHCRCVVCVVVCGHPVDGGGQSRRLGSPNQDRAADPNLGSAPWLSRGKALPPPCLSLLITWGEDTSQGCRD